MRAQEPIERGSNKINLDSKEVWETRRDLAACFRMAARYGFEEGICNHLSALVPGRDDLFIVNPYGYSFREISASALLICDFQGNVVSGNGRPESTALHIHARVHKKLARGRVIFHTHMPHATALSMTEGEPLIFAGQTALKFYGRTAVDPNYNGLALDEREGDRIADAVGTADVLFMKNHGVLVVASTIAEAWDDLYYLERACQAQCLALATGRKLVPIDRDIAQATARQMRAGDSESASLHLSSIRRILDLEDSVYAS